MSLCSVEIVALEGDRPLFRSSGENTGGLSVFGKKNNIRAPIGKLENWNLEHSRGQESAAVLTDSGGKHTKEKLKNTAQRILSVAGSCVKLS